MITEMPTIKKPTVHCLQMPPFLPWQVLSGRELKIYNFDEGLFVMKLKQIMNQKMPYYGLHNQDHVVALSRDRMYVNMMNLQNGDCVATFKVSPRTSTIDAIFFFF